MREYHLDLEYYSFKDEKLKNYKMIFFFCVLTEEAMFS